VLLQLIQTKSNIPHHCTFEIVKSIVLSFAQVPYAEVPAQNAYVPISSLSFFTCQMLFFNFL